MTQVDRRCRRSRPPGARLRRAPGVASCSAWLGLVPFFLFAFAVLCPADRLPRPRQLPGRRPGQLTLQNYAEPARAEIIRARSCTSIEISLVTAIAGGIFGFLLAYAVILGGLPRFLRTAAHDLLRRRLELRRRPARPGLHLHARPARARDTSLLQDTSDRPLRATGFKLYTKLGLELVYLYFQFPLMVLIIAPAIDGLKREWREAAENMGATPAPVLAPRRPADPHAVDPRHDDPAVRQRVRRPGHGLPADRRRSIPSSTLVIGAQISGDVLHNPGLGYAMAMGMVVIMAVSIALYTSSSAAPSGGCGMTGPAAIGLARPSALEAIGRAQRRARGGVSGGRIVSWVVFILGVAVLLRCRWSRRSLFSLRPKPFGPAYANVLRRPAVLRQPALLVRRRHRSRSSSASLLIVPDRLLGPAARCRACGPSSSSSRCCRSSSRRSSSSSG